MIEASPCGSLECRFFDSAPDALSYVMESQPLVLGIGEAHALSDSNVESAAKRFARDLLPRLKGAATHVVIEALLPDPRCVSETDAVRREQSVVTVPQARTNGSEYVALGHAASRLGIVPYPLRPSCDQLSRVLSAGDGVVLEMMPLIARLTAQKVSELVAENHARGRSGVVLTYGGALHNDVEPRPDRREWSFGPELVRGSGGRYVELDLIVPEFIKDTEAWRSLPWYGAYDPHAHPDKATLVRIGPAAYVLIFRRS